MDLVTRSPGAGKKSAETVAYQGSRRGQVEQVVTADEWEKVIRAQLRQAKRGNVKAAAWLTPWVMGAEPKELTIQVDVEERIRILAAAIGLEPEDALREAQGLLALTGTTE